MTQSGGFEVVNPDHLPNFSNLGGMESLKAQLRASIGLVLAYPNEASQLRVDFNGILFFGPPGSGRSYTARATAGEYGLNLVSVSAAELKVPLLGESSDRVTAAFQIAGENAPCILFFDELDAVARRRDDAVLTGEDRAVLSQLLHNLDAIRSRQDVFVMAATSDLQGLDAAVLRPGRFDRQIRFDLPDNPARRAIFEAQLKGRPCDATIDCNDLAERSKGFSAARIVETVNTAALSVLQAVAGGHTQRQITQADLIAAIDSGRGKDRPTVDTWKWEQLILPEPTKRELQELQRLIESPDRARALGIMVPTGALLYGPPGTGKTTVARVLAAQAKASFYPIKGSDIVSKWLGESERNVADLFARARANAPSIIFIDEIDALVARRTEARGAGPLARLVNQVLQEMDGLGSTTDVFVLGATNRPDILDPALLRGGRLGRQIEIPLPTLDQRCALLTLFTRAMPLAPDVDCAQLAAKTPGYSGADLQALCQEAGVQALLRDSAATTITATDFAAALAGHRKQPLASTEV